MTNTTEKKQLVTPHWHTEYGESVLEYVGSTRRGLSKADVDLQREKHGANTLPSAERPTLVKRLYDQLRSPLTLVLVGAFVLTMVLEEYTDATVIAVALLIAVGVGLLQEGKASKAFVSLLSSQTFSAQVRRAGQRYQISTDEVVVGDIVFLEAGMQVPADARLLSATDLSINEAALTGEWLAVNKSIEPLPAGTPETDQTNMCFRGTYVANGTGLAVVVRTGPNTIIGKLATELDSMQDVETPLQREIEKVSRYMLMVITVLIVGIFLLGTLRGLPIEEMLVLAVAIAVASVPEGLPAALTIILAIGMEALLKRGGLVKNLLAAETLGSTTFVLTDKTGTLTEGRMAVTGAIQGLQVQHFTDSAAADLIPRDLIESALFATDAFYDSEKKVVRGDAVEAAILKLAERYKIVDFATDWTNDRVSFRPFSSEARFAAGIREDNDEHTISVNGAYETVFSACTHIEMASGQLVPITEELSGKLRELVTTESAKGSRLIAVATKNISYHDLPKEAEHILNNLTLRGILIFTDPVRTDIKSAIDGVESAGARILLVTGDNAATARSVAATVGINLKNVNSVTGKDIERLGDEELLHAIESGVSVFARVLPKQKLRIATLLQGRGEIVAMTGDGINDSLALQRANIGIAVGSGTEVAKEAADLILVDDSFAVIYAAIEEGRRIVSNLKKIVGYLLSTAMSEVVLIAAALVTAGPAPLTAVQILYSNIVEEGFMSMAFAFDKGEKNAMQRRPQDIHKDGILSRDMILFMLFSVTVLSLLSLGLYFYLRFYIEVSFTVLQSAMFLLIAVDSMFMAFAFRSLTTPLWSVSLTSNKFFLGAFAGNVVLLVLVLSVPQFQEWLSYEPLEWNYIMLVVGVSLASLLTIEVGKWLFFERQHKMVN